VYVSVCVCLYVSICLCVDVAWRATTSSTTTADTVAISARGAGDTLSIHCQLTTNSTMCVTLGLG